MSGGSYNYLCYADDLEGLVRKRGELEQMAERLARLGYAKDAAVETRTLIADLDAFDVRLGVALARLADVWQAVEWWDSCDYSEEQVHAALAKYRGGET